MPGAVKYVNGDGVQALAYGSDALFYTTTIYGTLLSAVFTGLALNHTLLVLLGILHRSTLGGVFLLLAACNTIIALLCDGTRCFTPLTWVITAGQLAAAAYLLLAGRIAKRRA